MPIGSSSRARDTQVEPRDEYVSRAVRHGQARVREVTAPEDARPCRRAHHQRGLDALGASWVGANTSLGPEGGATSAEVDATGRERHDDGEGVAVLVRVKVAARRVTVDCRLPPREAEPEVAEVVPAIHIGHSRSVSAWAQGC